MKHLKKLTALVLAGAMALGLTACGAKEKKAAETKPAVLNIAYQYGLAYAPLIVVRENKLIESKYKEATGNTVEVVWNQMSSGADINTGIASGSINAGFMGIAPAINGIAKKVGYKIFTNLSGQEHGMMSNSAATNSLGDLIGSSEQIALVNIGSIQHIILGMALEANGYDAHALDSNLVAMKHPDGMTSLLSGNIATHLTSNPYIYKERAESTLHELDEVKNVWSADKTFIVGVASESLQANDPALYKALSDAFTEAVASINADFEATAKLTCEFDGNSFEDEVTFLKAGKYSTATTGIFELAGFMYDNGFTETKFESYSDLVFPNVTGD